jgi:serine O-acetyltransferase
MKSTTEYNIYSYLSSDVSRAHYLFSGNNIIFPKFKVFIRLLSPRLMPVFLYRISHFLYHANLGFLAKLIALVNFFLFGIEIAVQCQIGKGLFLPHTQGTVIGAYSIGDNAIIFQGVTLGAKELDFYFQENLRPVLGHGVTVGAGAKVLGGIVIGDGSSIGANAVVLESVPAHVLSAGIPAIIKKKLD